MEKTYKGGVVAGGNSSNFLESAYEEYKGYYMEIVINKLKELDYDNLERVAVYACRPSSFFHDEANALLDWHEKIVLKNYAIMDDVKEEKIAIPTKEEYLAMLPKYEEVV